MTYTVCNSVTHSVTNDPTNGVANAERTTVQNQNQNQIVVTASRPYLQDQVDNLKVGTRLPCGCEHRTVSMTFLGLAAIA